MRGGRFWGSRNAGAASASATGKQVDSYEAVVCRVSALRDLRRDLGVGPWSFAMWSTIIGLLHLILFLIAAFEILSSSRPLLHKVGWLLLVFLLPIVGLIIYFLLGRGK